jgi:hypothetical protein
MVGAWPGVVMRRVDVTTDVIVETRVYVDLTVVEGTVTVTELVDVTTGVV